MDRWIIMLVLLWCSVCVAEDPVFDAIDYQSPQNYLSLPDSIGNSVQIAAQAHKLKAEADQQTVANVLDWMNSNLKCQTDLAYHWRNYDTVIRDGCYGSCADYAIVCGALLRGAGISAVWVKTMDVPWIWDFKQGRPYKSWSGHVFLEIYIDKQWVLLDPGARQLYMNYSTESRILPGNRFAYHKGNDPRSMIMSLQWDNWKQQTRKYFTNLDESLLPVDVASKVSLRSTKSKGRECYVIGNSPFYQQMTQMARERGFRYIKSFNTHYEKYLPQAKGQTLYVETHAGTPLVKQQVLETYFPGAFSGVKKGQIQVEGTSIIFVDFPKENVVAEGQEKTLDQRVQFLEEQVKVLQEQLRALLKKVPDER